MADFDDDIEGVLPEDGDAWDDDDKWKKRAKRSLL